MGVTSPSPSAQAEARSDHLNSRQLLLWGALQVHLAWLSKRPKGQAQPASPERFRMPFWPRPSQKSPSLEWPGITSHMWLFGWTSPEQPEATVMLMQMACLIASPSAALASILETSKEHQGCSIESGNGKLPLRWLESNFHRHHIPLSSCFHTHGFHSLEDQKWTPGISERLILRSWVYFWPYHFAMQLYELQDYRANIGCILPSRTLEGNVLFGSLLMNPKNSLHVVISPQLAQLSRKILPSTPGPTTDQHVCVLPLARIQAEKYC